MSDKKMNRRDLLKASALGSLACYSTSFKFFLDVVSEAVISSAHASDEVRARNYVFIQLPGAPPRWTWDPLVPFDNDSDIVANAQVGTRYKNTTQPNYSEVQYKSVALKGLNMPWGWKFNVPKPGGMRPMSDLIDHMMIIRGVNCNNPAHSGAQQLQFTPSNIDQSLTALSADQNSEPLPHIDMGTNNTVFLSKHNKSRIRINNSSNFIAKILDPFKDSGSSSFKANFVPLENEIDAAVAALSEEAEYLHPGAKELNTSQANADSLVTKDFGDLNLVWSNLRNKYLDLVNRASDKSQNLTLLIDAKLGNERKNISFDLLADYFATTEFLLTQKLSSSIAFKVNRSVTFDEHGVGKIESLYINTLLNRVLASCLLELTDALKSSAHGDLFSETLIHIGGEFGRKPRNNGEGSDHSPESGSSTLISGCLKGREVVGDILKEQSSSGRYTGTFGVQAPSSRRDGGTPILLNPSYLANSIADILRAPRPVTAVGSIVEENNSGKFRSTLRPGKMKAA